MPFVMTFVVFLALAVAVAFAGMKLYVKPKEAIERVVGGIDQDAADAVASQSCVSRPDQEDGELHSAIAQRRNGDAAPPDPGRRSQ